MRLSRPRRVVGAAVSAVALAAGAVVAAVATPSSAEAVVQPYGTSVQSNGLNTVGAIFPGPVSGRHTCSGTVVFSQGGPVVLTAAHCITGNAVGWTFAPAYHDGIAPYGSWRVAGAYVDPRWNGGRGWQYDVAALRLDKKWINGAWRSVSYLTGSAKLANAPAAGTVVDVMGYGLGYGGKAWACSNRVARPWQGVLVTCNWLPTGVSGSGMRFGSDGHGHQFVGGALGGYQQGGCFVNQAYSSLFGPWVSTLVWRADTAQRADTLPSPVWDGCTNIRP